MQEMALIKVVEQTKQKFNTMRDFWHAEGKYILILTAVFLALFAGLGFAFSNMDAYDIAAGFAALITIITAWCVFILRPFFQKKKLIDETNRHVVARAFALVMSMAVLAIADVYIVTQAMRIEQMEGIIAQSLKQPEAVAQKAQTVKKVTVAQVFTKKDTRTVPEKAGIIELNTHKNVSYDLAPAAPEELRESQVKGYIDRFSKLAVAEKDQFGIPASITMAQAIIESRSGTSILAVKNNNHFGIKCFSKTCPKGHCSNYTDDSHKDFFLKFNSAWESFRAHSKLLVKNGYKDAAKGNTNYAVWAKVLRERGYATDLNYNKKLIAIIKRYELDRLDTL